MRKSDSSDSVISLENCDNKGKKYPIVSYESESTAQAAATAAAGGGRRKNLFENTKKTNDDSHSAFANQFVPGISNAQHTPQLEGVERDNREDYEAWLKKPTLNERKIFPHHDEWQDNLSRLGHSAYTPTISIKDLPADDISIHFKQAVMQHNQSTPNPKIESFLGKTKIPAEFNDLPVYVPVFLNPIEVKTKENNDATNASGSVNKNCAATHISETASVRDHSAATREQEWIEAYESKAIRVGNKLSPYQGNAFDELLIMRDRANEDNRLQTSSMNPIACRIPLNKFMVVSDHNGNPDGTRLQIWSGVKPALKMASASFGQNLARVDNTDENYDLNATFLTLPSCTIVQINANEVGFCHNRNNQRIERMLPGRYVLDRNCHFVGKAAINLLTGKPVPVESTNKENNVYTQWAKDLSVLFVPTNHMAFIASREGTFALTHSETPYIINQREGFTFVGSMPLSNKVCHSAESTPSYFTVTLQQPGEYIIFKDKTTPMVWHYDAEHPEYNTIHLSSAYFAFDGRVHNSMTGKAQLESVTVLTRQETEFAVLRDGDGHIRFLEDSGSQPITLRAPWQHIQTVSKTQRNHTINVTNNASVTRIIPTQSEWIAVISGEGRFELVPPMLNNQPYYFYQPDYTFLGVVNFRQPGEQQFNVPGIGEVTIVNLQTGSMGLCVLNNMNFFTSPSPEPQVFIPPNRYIKTVSSTEPHIQHGDLHRFCLAPDQRAVVIKNGTSIVLPMAESESKEESMITQDAENGIYIFRAERLKVEGPKQTSEKRYRLGSYEFFNVNVGEVAYGNVGGKVTIWGPGNHRLDNKKDEWLTDFFATNVDPVKIVNFPITSKHGITSHIDIFVTYSIEQPHTTINRFKAHLELHKFIEETTRSNILQLCANQPPIGYTDGDFSTMQSATKITTAHKEGEDAVAKIQDSFRGHVSSLLREYGIKLGDMHITSWTIDPEFTQKARELALGLQENRASYERDQINLQKQELSNKTKVLQLEQQRLSTVNAATQKAEIQAAESQANAKAEAAKATAEADKKAKIAEAEAYAVLARQKAEAEAEVARAAAKTQVAQQEIEALKATREKATIENQIATERAKSEAEQRKQTAILNAETRAFEETAELRAKANARREVAALELEAAKIEAQRMEILAEAKNKVTKLEGEAAAACISADINARYKNASGDALIELEKTKIEAETQRTIAGNTQITTHTLTGNDAREILKMLLTSGMIAAQASVLSNASFFSSGPRLPTTPPSASLASAAASAAASS
jgi:hypothetical protein